MTQELVQLLRRYGGHGREGRVGWTLMKKGGRVVKNMGDNMTWGWIRRASIQTLDQTKKQGKNSRTLIIGHDLEDVISNIMIRAAGKDGGGKSKAKKLVKENGKRKRRS